ncbi:MAG: glycoside hydrolase family 20 zincin-like fold domain-containing protein [Kiritimatiellales bacterium]|nr:glycoside hydrolase family 20 zincin-like fold domain-containing protein [Kiritimatiellales bacterium]
MKYGLLVLCFCVVPSLLHAAVVMDQPGPQAAFGRDALLATGVACDVRMSIVEDDALKSEGFRIVRKGDQIRITAIDAAGLMYGGLEVAELLREGGIKALKNALQNPYMQMRGTKFNAPLDLRTPSYTDVCDSAQVNIPTMWDFSFWTEYIDALASARYNYISMWSLHPFPSLVKVPGYEKVALNDVLRSRTIRAKEYYSLLGQGFVSPEILEDAEVVKKMTIDEKIDFWRQVMAYGKSRNVDFYFVTWNIFTDGTFGQYGITEKVDNPVTVDYFRKSVAQMFLTYPDLAGIGLTTGENMPKVNQQEKEDWAFATYGQGVLDAAKAMPGRKIRFIHRQHMASAQAVLDTFEPLVENPDIDFVFSFKYAKAHVYSSTKQPYHEKFVKDLAPRGVKTIWTLRNDDTFQFRWGAPGFVREFMENIPYDVSQGYYFGSDQWIWGREFLHRSGPSQGELELKKHAYQWMLWGRLGYDPTLSDKRIIDWLGSRFDLDATQARVLFDAWQNASMIYPTVTGFHWGSLDFQWYIEGCESKPSYSKTETGFNDVNFFISLPPHPYADCQSIPDFVAGKKSDKQNPMQVADRLEDYSNQAEALLKKLNAAPGMELARSLADIDIVAAMGRYYTEKIRGSTQLALFRETQKPEHQAKAIEHLVKAARAWQIYTEKVLALYKNPLWTNRVGYVDLKANYLCALDDIRIAGGNPAIAGFPAELATENEPVARPWGKAAQ